MSGSGLTLKLKKQDVYILGSAAVLAYLGGADVSHLVQGVIPFLSAERSSQPIETHRPSRTMQRPKSSMAVTKIKFKPFI